jgi:hypothetical protein
MILSKQSAIMVIATVAMSSGAILLEIGELVLQASEIDLLGTPL